MVRERTLLSVQMSEGLLTWKRIWNNRNMSRTRCKVWTYKEVDFSSAYRDFSHTQAGSPGCFLLRECLGRSQGAV